ncbi:uncharacterized protein J4E88_005236 [Alternaria novae-zelandiae]|uniref:uncharacterized protein n=1 Tax=Alternaria novae-zelandiae TaxID=430562 RepID=UPI0020C4FF44|nr:uncharacterized protein J4E88_005236 [Alternaria novae-zelandiae]KAI4682346.1 hypothetical protein J4E88_005236 [Alternaria novae-zelandiae]
MGYIKMSPKRKKTGHGDDPPKAKKTRSEDTPDDDTTKTDVNWFIPKEKGKNIYKEKCAAEYAQILYEKAREEISPQQAPLLDPQFRTPVFQKQGKDLRAGDKYRPSASLRNLFNDIKSRSIDKEEGHSITHFQQQFGDDANIAVVLSRAEDNATFVLNEDQRLEVPVGYFIELPLNTSITVNGTTYTNSDDSSSMPFYIGPLEGYAIIELLSQPAFFFRTAASLKETSSHRAVPQEELDRRDGNGDVALGNTRVRWGPIGAPLPSAGSGNPSVPGEVERESEDDFIDTFTDEGEPIKDLDAYMRAQLLSHQQSRYRELIPRVLASVNYRQKEATGFSYQHEGQTFRPGRTLLQPIEKDGNHLLLAAQIHTDKHITLEVLDPMTWRSTLSSRKAIDEHIRETLRSSTWWRHVFDSLDQMEENLPEATMWLPAAQVTTGDGSFIYAVLNAWALAMGLAPNPSFTSSAHGHESFFIRAQQIFDLDLQDTLNWRVLLAFFRCTGFVKPSEGSENDEEANLPRLSSRFDLGNRSFQKLIARHTAADAAAEGKKIDMELVTLGLEDGMRHDLAFAADSLSELERTNLTSIVRDGQWNFADTEEKLKKRLDERKEQKMSDMSLTKTTPPPPPPPHKSTPDTEEIPVDFDPCKHLHEQIKLLEEQGKIEPKVGSEIDEALPSRWSQAVFGYIEPVVRAINDLLSPERPQRGFTLADLNGNSRYADDSGVLDTVVMMVCQLREHVILVVLQHEDASKEAPDVSRVMDSAPWIATAKERIQIHNLLIEAGMLAVDPTADKVKSFVGPVLQWMPGPQQAQVIEAGYIAIMSAWAVLLGLPINPEFSIGADFYDSALPLLQAVVKAHADWKLIWAFLRCVGYTQSEQPPPIQRRFKATRPARGPRITRGNRKTKRSIETQACRDINYPHFPVNTGVAHTEAFPWDNYDKPDRSTRIPELITSGMYSKVLSIAPAPSGGSKGDYPKPSNNGDKPLGDPARPQNPGESTKSVSEKTKETSGNPKEKSALPENFDPCEYFNQQRNALLSDPAVAAAVESLRSRATTTFGLWLKDEEVSLAIAAVTLGITNAQDLEGGFGCLDQTAVQYCRHENPMLMQPTIRPGRPLIVPVNIDNHIILVVIQFDGSKKEPTPTISILDSKSHNYSFERRAHVFDTARNIFIASRWGRFPNLPDEGDLRQYTREALHAEWIPVAPQPTDNECGYYTILNAWALALGLQPNINFFPSWTAQFFQDLIDVIHIARVGRADWRLIYAFLRCKEFVDNAAAVPEDRHFDRTENLPRDEALESVLDRLEDSERRDWEGRDPDFPKLAQANRTHVVPGKRHDKVWPSDDWTEEARKQYVKDLERWGKLVLDTDSKGLKEQWDQHFLMHGVEFENHLEHIHGKLKDRTLDITKDILPHYREFLNKLHPPGLNVQIDHFPCAWKADAINLYDCILNYEPLAPSFSNGMREEINRQECQPWEINMAIAAVIEAIDDKQRELHRMNSADGQPFAGGFSMAPTDALREALLKPLPADHPVASRPRRCWFMPLNVSGPLLERVNAWQESKGHKVKHPSTGGGHTLLMVLQERDDQPNTNHLRVDTYTLDSHPTILENAHEFLGRSVLRAAGRLGWSSHRNTAQVAGFNHRYPVPKQQTGGFQCGYHVFVNAWILAMGLTPDTKRGPYNEKVYFEAWLFARAAIAGLLDWKALVAWFFCRKLTVERTYEAVPANRRFEGTVPQVPDRVDDLPEAEGEGELLDHIQQRYDADDRPLALLSIEDAPYDRSNNIVWPPSKGKEQEDQGKSLDRSYDDADLEFFEAQAGVKRKSREEIDDGLGRFYSSHATVDTRVRDTVHSSFSRKRQRLSDSLSFLDGY